MCNVCSSQINTKRETCLADAHINVAYPAVNVARNATRIDQPNVPDGIISLAIGIRAL